VPTARDRGQSGEAIAALHLERLGYRILGRNYRIQRGEIDLVALDSDGSTLCFVEVRARKDDRFGRPEETVGRIKRSRLVRAAGCWLAGHPHEGACRFDVVGICGDRVTLIRDAFRS
jgi:putative endonuclease